ncbi:MAG: carboxylesterase family protein [Leucobacter sp.]
MTPHSQPEAAPAVATSSGAIRGFWQHPGIATFRGIPYAEAPVGELRFAAPRPRRRWSGVLEATEYGPTPQRGDTGITRIPEHSIPGEDTLSVNVTTPALDPESKLPVIVWIHGGGYVSGSPASPWYDGAAFARDGVVLVTLSYRLGFTGFGYIEGAVQNRGVLDWICALQWVRDHIASFGGDPSRVTVAGQSAGGSAVLTLLGAPAAVGLFHGAYGMSAAVADPSLKKAKHRSGRLARLAGVSPDLAGFSSLSETRILELQPKVTSPAPPHLLHDIRELLHDGLMIGPIVDGEIVVSEIETAVSQGPSARAPLVLGTTEDELTGLLGRPADAAHPSVKQRIARHATEAVFHSWVPRIAAAREASPVAGPTYSYRFSWHPAESPYAGHCIDVPFVFDRLEAPGVEQVAGANPPQELADAVHGGLVSFAKTLQPGWAPDTGDGPSRVFDLPVRDESVFS